MTWTDENKTTLDKIVEAHMADGKPPSEVRQPYSKAHNEHYMIKDQKKTLELFRSIIVESRVLGRPLTPARKSKILYTVCSRIRSYFRPY